MVRLDRQSSTGGGVAILIRRGLRYKILPHPKTTIIEAIGVEISTLRGAVTLLAVYAPRQCVDRNGTSNQFKEDLQKLTNSKTGFVVAGDLNARDPLWQNHTTNKNGALLAYHLTTGMCVLHHPDEPTFVSPAGATSTLDIFLSDLPISKPVTHQELSSDHLPARFGKFIRKRTNNQF